MRYLITGHTGFKGSWLALMLLHEGHEVAGISLDPEAQSLFQEASLSSSFYKDIRLDIRNKEALAKAVQDVNPEVIIHLAAQPLVRYSYKHPVDTFETNVIGTLNLLEATRNLRSLKATLIITTDKVYKNVGSLSGYLESDSLGGDDPYSASKAAADIATQSWTKSFATSPIAIARAGNVVGGGDWAQDRLIPDLVRSYSVGETPVIRNPNSVRPWQHVLDCLNGYLMLIDSMLNNSTVGEWNFGPDHRESHVVSEVIEVFASAFGLEQKAWNLDSGENPPESNFLLLDSTKSRVQLGWRDFLDFHQTLTWTAEWYREIAKNDVKASTLDQISRFYQLKDAW